MGEKRNLLINSNNVSLTVISRLLISLFFIQFFCVPALAQEVVYNDGYNVITNDDGSKDIISGALNYLRYDGVWRPKEELNISNGSWPYLYTENATTADFKVDDTTLSIPKAHIKLKLKQNSISYDIIVPKAELLGKGVSSNSKRAPIRIPYDLKSKKPKTKYQDRTNIKYGRLHFKAGTEDIAIHDDTLRDYIEAGEVVQDVTYLFPGDYNYGVDNNGEIKLEFLNDSLNKLTGNVTIEIRTWDIIGPNNWGGNVAFSQAADVKATGNVELKQKVTDYSLYTRFDEGTGTVIHNENILTRPLGNLLGTVGTGTWTTGKYGKAIHFDGVKNKVLFNDHPDFRLPYDFTISFFIRMTSDVNNVDTDITRKGSTATANPDQWWKVEIKNNKMQGVVYKGESNEIAEKDTVARRDGNWHFVAYTRAGTTCSLMVDGSTVASRTNCKTNAVNSAQLAIGAKDTETSGTGTDYTHGTIDEVRFFNRKLSSSEFTSIRNNEHFTSGTVTRNLGSIIKTGEEIKELGCYGTWDSLITKVDVMASTNNINWVTIKSNAAPNINYPVNPGNNYKYSRCRLTTTDSSKTPIIQSIRANIALKGSSSSYTISVSTSPAGLSPQPSGGGQYNSGQTATVTAQPVSGYTFQRWTEGGNQVSTSASYSFAVTGNRNLVAVYSQNTGSYTISVSTSPAGLSPQPSGGGQYNSGQTATV
ncbi:MAG: LamG domain-containing protein, partial [Candidatus Methanoperedens sp.]|nr:LamG domain-containing protein [Candidatus Methanoperedens sp.]